VSTDFGDPYGILTGSSRVLNGSGCRADLPDRCLSGTRLLRDLRNLAARAPGRDTKVLRVPPKEGQRGSGSLIDLRATAADEQPPEPHLHTPIS